MTTEIADLIAAAEQAATILDDTIERLHEMKRELPDERREDVLHAADRAGHAWAATRALIVALGFAYLTTPTPPRSTPPPLELHQRGLL